MRLCPYCTSPRWTETPPEGGTAGFHTASPAKLIKAGIFRGSGALVGEDVAWSVAFALVVKRLSMASMTLDAEGGVEEDPPCVDGPPLPICSTTSLAQVDWRFAIKLTKVVSSMVPSGMKWKSFPQPPPCMSARSTSKREFMLYPKPSVMSLQGCSASRPAIYLEGGMKGEEGECERGSIIGQHSESENIILISSKPVVYSNCKNSHFRLLTGNSNLSLRKISTRELIK